MRIIAEIEFDSRFVLITKAALCRHCQTETSAMPSGMAGNCPSLRLSTPASLSQVEIKNTKNAKKRSQHFEDQVFPFNVEHTGDSSDHGQFCMGLHSCS